MMGDLKEGFGAQVCTGSGGTVTDWNGVPACAYPDVGGGTAYIELGSGRTLHRTVVSGVDKPTPLTAWIPLLIISGALFWFTMRTPKKPQR